MSSDAEGWGEAMGGAYASHSHLDKVHVAIDTIKDWTKCPKG